GVLKLIEMTCQAAKKNNIWVGVCGGIASDVQAIPFLIGLGVTELSVSVPMIGEVKSSVRSYSMVQCQSLAQQALIQKSATEVRKLV
ncbi:MAG: phosphoenolpyruvate--protein phosphotransferase, partial [Halobacteriovoraceae bacterium]|nr:phosphoenolpyruvate--protein phosphotransferase [Halobacteriovoraceae bacterium]